MYQDNSRLDFHALGREIKRKREAKGWTQEYLAQLVDRTPRSIIYFENRGQHLSLNAFYKNVTVISVGFPGDALTASNSSVATLAFLASNSSVNTLDIFAPSGGKNACQNTCWGASPNPAFGISCTKVLLAASQALPLLFLIRALVRKAEQPIYICLHRHRISHGILGLTVFHIQGLFQRCQLAAFFF